MKLLIASDLHGSAYYTEKLLNHYKNEGVDRLILLGDVLYHGPRNDLPKGYDCKKTAEFLNAEAENITAVRGNCDGEVDQMMLEFPILSDYALLYDGKVNMFLTHGHIFNRDNLPKLQKGTVLLNGHFHVSEFSKENDFYYANPGSVSIPKGNMIRSFIVYEDGVFTLKTLKGGSILGEFEV